MLKPEGSIWNLDLYDRPLVVEISPGTTPDLGRATCNGGEAPVQRLEGDRILVMAEEIVVPALGAVPLRFSQGSGSAVSSPVLATSDAIENEFLRIEFRAEGTIGSIYDKECRREVLADRGNQLWLYTDIPRRQFEAWDVEVRTATKELNSWHPPRSRNGSKNGPLRGALRVARRHEGNEIVQTYRLSRYSRVLEIHNAVHWCGRQKAPPRTHSGGSSYA